MKLNGINLEKHQVGWKGYVSCRVALADQFTERTEVRVVSGRYLLTTLFKCWWHAYRGMKAMERHDRSARIRNGWMMLLALLPLCTPAFAADVAFTPLDNSTTGIETALQSWQQAELAAQGKTAPTDPGFQWSLWGVNLWDQNGDGKRDLFVNSHVGIGGVLLRNTSGTAFVNANLLPTREYPEEHKPTVMDLDNNGFLDLVPHTTHLVGNKLILNDGITLTIGQSAGAIHPYRYGTQLNLDADGYLDMRRLDRDRGFNRQMDYRNLFGDVPPVPNFQLTTTTEPDPEDLPQSIVDWLASMRANNGALAGTYHSPWYQEIDVDDDGDEDLLIQFAGSYSGTMRSFVCLRNGTGDLEDKTAELGLPVADKVILLPAADVTGDGRIDLFVCAAASSSTSGFYPQNAGGGFTLTPHTGDGKLLNNHLRTSSLVSVPEYPDLNNDGLPDVVIGRNSQIGVYQNTGTASLRHVLTNVMTTIEAFDVGDADGDGLLDIAVCGPLATSGTAFTPSKTLSTQFTLFRNSTAGAPPPPPPPPPPPSGTIKIFVNGNEVPGATIKKNGQNVNPPATGEDRYDVDGVPMSMSHPLDSVDPTSPAAVRFLSSLSDPAQDLRYPIKDTTRLFQLALAYKLTRDEQYGQRAGATLKAHIAESRRLLAAGLAPPPMHGYDSYQSGDRMRDWCYALSWCGAFVDVGTRDTAETLIRETAFNLWHPKQATWLGVPNTKWGGFPGLKPENNYAQKMYLATALAARYLRDDSLLEVPRPAFGDYYGRSVGGGSIDGCGGYGTSLRHLFELGAVPRQYAVDSVDYWTHCLTPDLDDVARIGVSQSRVFDLHRVMMLQLWHQTRSPRAAWWLRTVRPRMGQPVNYCWDMLDVDGPSEAPTALSHDAPFVGHYFARSSWQTDAAFLAFSAGQHNAAQEHQGAFCLFAGSWLTDQQAGRTGTGLFAKAEHQNVVRFERDGEIVRPIRKHWPDTLSATCEVTDDGTTWRAVADLSPIYPGGIEWRRTVVFDRGASRISITDTTQTDATAAWQLQLPTQPRIEANVVTCGRLQATFPCGAVLTLLDWTTQDPRPDGTSYHNSGWRVDCAFEGEITVLLEVV